MASRATSGPARAGLAFLVALAVSVAPVEAETVQSFDADGTGTPWQGATLGPPPPCPPQLLPGGPSGVGRFLRLVHGLRAAAGCDAAEPPAGPDVSSNSIAFDLTDPGAFPYVVADFDLRLAPATGRADGLGFALLDTSVFGTSGPVGGPAFPFVAEEPNFEGSLGIGFDIFQSADLQDADANHVSIHFDAVENQVRIADVSARDALDLGGARWLHVRVVVHATAGGSEVSVIVTPCRQRAVVLVDAFPVPDMAPYEARAYFAARSGGLTADFEIDNVRVQFLTQEPRHLSFEAHLLEVVETDSAAEITVHRSGDTTGTASVQVATQDLTASAGTDYLETNQTLTFAAGETARSLAVPLLDDAAANGERTFRVVLQPMSGATLGGPATTVVRIVDDETARVVGHWSPVECWPIVPIHLHALPTGDVLAWGRVGHGELPAAAPFDRIRLWDPDSRELSTPTLPPHDVFCSGHAFLADGRLLVTGGHIADNTGLPDVIAYDASTDAWSDSVPEMNAGRWYPTNVVLPTGDVLVESGDIVPGTVNTLPQVLDVADETWRDLVVAEASRPPIADLYPRLLLAPDGRVFKAGPDRDSHFLDTRGAGEWVPGTAGSGPLSSPLLEPPESDPNRPRTYGAAVIRDGVVLLVGGADPPTDLVDFLDLNAADPAWRPVGPLHFPRRHLNATILADGSVLVTGGTSSAEFNVADQAVLDAEVWSPETEDWTLLSPMATKRIYHSTAVLLQDGRVLVGGGGQPNAEGDIDHADVEVFSPPYLFRGPRPVIASAPDEVTTDEPFAVTTPDAASVERITLVRLGSTTHAFDQNQRLVTPTYSPIPGGFAVAPPADPRLAPPGHYFLFLIDDQGTPSLGHLVRLDFRSVLEIFSDDLESGDVGAWSGSVPEP